MPIVIAQGEALKQSLDCFACLLRCYAPRNDSPSQ